MPLVASVLIGVGLKVGLGLAASAAKKLMEPAAGASPAAFPKLLEAESARGASPASLSTPPGARVPYDLPGRLAAEGLHGVALDAQAQRGFGGPPLISHRYDDGPLAAYRRMDQAP